MWSGPCIRIRHLNLFQVKSKPVSQPIKVPNSIKYPHISTSWSFHFLKWKFYPCPAAGIRFKINAFQLNPLNNGFLYYAEHPED